METEKEIGKPFAFGNAFGCAYEENGVMYVHGVGGNGAPEGCNYIDVYYSTDLCEWKTQRAITLPECLHIYNTSVCKDADGYIMAIEVNGPREIIGERFTVVFARSKDLLDWTLMPIDKYIFYKERYSACPSIRYFDGMYYMVFSAIDENKVYHIGIASSATPEGPFKDCLGGKPLYSTGYSIIDASLLFDDDGRIYMYYSRDCSENVINGFHVSQSYGIEVAPDLMSVIGEPVLLTTPTLPGSFRRANTSGTRVPAF